MSKLIFLLHLFPPYCLAMLSWWHFSSVMTSVSSKWLWNDRRISGNSEANNSPQTWFGGDFHWTYMFLWHSQCHHFRQGHAHWSALVTCPPMKLNKIDCTSTLTNSHGYGFLELKLEENMMDSEYLKTVDGLWYCISIKAVSEKFEESTHKKWRSFSN